MVMSLRRVCRGARVNVVALGLVGTGWWSEEIGEMEGGGGWSGRRRGVR